MKIKKLFLAMALSVLMIGTVVYAQTWHTANQATVAWDAVAPIATGDTIKYQVYSKIGEAGNPTKVGEVTREKWRRLETMRDVLEKEELLLKKIAEVTAELTKK